MCYDDRIQIVFLCEYYQLADRMLAGVELVIILVGVAELLLLPFPLLRQGAHHLWE